MVEHRTQVTDSVMCKDIILLWVEIIDLTLLNPQRSRAGL
jgi:hypothetical protein